LETHIWEAEMRELDRLNIALALPRRGAEELKEKLAQIDPSIVVRISEADQDQLAEELGFDIRKEAIAWAAITAIGSGTTGVALDVASHYIYDYFHKPEAATELLVRDGHGGSMYLRQQEAVSSEEVGKIVHDFVTVPKKNPHIGVRKKSPHRDSKK
jgi:hypothetical protein